MENFEIQVLLKDGSFADYDVQFSDNEYMVLERGKRLITFNADNSSSWNVVSNEGALDPDLQERIINQLKGLII